MGEERNVDVSVFISHKHEDEAMARAIKERGQALAGPHLQVFLSEDIPIGATWYEVIRKNLEEANLLLLLFTDPGASWDWCLYEAGLFQGFFRARDDNNHHVVCLHHPQIQPPGPLQHLQTVPAQQEKMEAFLKDFWYTDKYTGRKLHNDRSLRPAKIRTMAKEICNLITRKPSIHYYSNYLRLCLSNLQEEQLNKTGELPDSTVIEAEDDTLKIFDLFKTPPSGQIHWTIGDLKKVFPEAGRGWLWEIGRACHAILQGRRFVLQARFRSPKDNKIYCPLIHREEVCVLPVSVVAF
ncbi:MAG: TIR domain-containing protein [Candidatus Binatia bacterium]